MAEQLSFGGVPVEDTFTTVDRRELIKQGLQLEKLTEDVLDLKILVNEQLKRTDIEERLRRLEDFKLELKSQVKTASLLIGICGTAVISGVEIILHLWLRSK